MSKNLIFIFVTICLVSCNVLPRKGYKKLQANAFITPLDNLKIIPKVNLALSDFKNFNLGVEDPVLSYKTSSQKSEIISSYETAQIDIDKTGRYLIEFESICSCFGFEKLIFEPLLEIRNKNEYSKIDINLINNEILGPSFTLAARLKKSWMFNVTETGSYLLLFYSDNSELNSPLGQRPSFGYYGTLTYNVSTFKSNVSGNFRVKISKID